MMTRSAEFSRGRSGLPEVITRVTVCPLAVSNWVYPASGASAKPALPAPVDGLLSPGWKLTNTMLEAEEEETPTRVATARLATNERPFVIVILFV
jgi:hypothetical protein